MQINITSLGLTLDLSRGQSAINPSVIEALVDEPLTFRSTGVDPIASAAINESPITPEGNEYTFTPASPGHTAIKVTFASGRRATLPVATFADVALRRVLVSTTHAKSRAAFIRCARPVLRSIARHGRMTDAGDIADGTDPAQFGGERAGVTLKDFA